MSDLPNDLSTLEVALRSLLLYFKNQKGELFRSDEPVGDLGVDSFEFFQRDRDLNKKGIIAIDLLRWEP